MRWKGPVIRLSTNVSKQTSRARNRGCCKHEKNKFEPYGDLVDQAFSQFNKTLISNQDPYSQIENDEKPGTKYLNEHRSEHKEANKPSEILNFMPQILADDEITVNSLNLKQREVFNVDHAGA